MRKASFFKTAVSFVFDGDLPAPGTAGEVSFGGGDEQFVMTIRRLDASSPEVGAAAAWGDPRMEGLEARLREVLAASGVAPADQSSILHALASDTDRAAGQASN